MKIERVCSCNSSTIVEIDLNAAPFVDFEPFDSKYKSKF